MRKIFLIALCALVFAACGSSTPADPDNFKSNSLQVIKGHVYLWDSGRGWVHDTNCIKCKEMSYRAHLAECSDSCITIKIYNI